MKRSGCGSVNLDSSDVQTAFHCDMKQQSLKISQSKAKLGIQVLSNSLNLGPQTLQNACIYYDMALKRNLTRGIRSALIYAASVYIACRIKGSMPMLLDVADASGVNAFELGKIYLRMIQKLTLTGPSLDPSVFLLRFVNSLDFGDKTKIVYTTAMRLLQRMMKDLIHTGRRLNGVCGAALLISGRLHKFNYTTGDIIKVVHCHKDTLNKRLLEFKNTLSSMLSIKEFITVNLEETCDSTSHQVARARDKYQVDKSFEANKNQNVTDKVKSIIDKELGKEKNATVVEDNLMEIPAAAAYLEPEDSCKPVNTGSSLEVIGLPENKPSYEDDNKPLSDVEIDEDEIDSYILSKKSYKLKYKMWMKIHGADYEMMQLKRKEKSKREKKVVRAKENNLEETHDPTSCQVACDRNKDQIDKSFEANKSQNVIDNGYSFRRQFGGNSSRSSSSSIP